MARPVKNNAEYFSHDKDMRNNEKLKAVRRKYSHLGYSIWNMLLERLCDADYFTIEYDDLSLELMAGDFEIEPELLKEILEYFQRLKLISMKDGTLFSQKMIDRLQPVLDKRQRAKEAYHSQKQDEPEPPETPEKPKFQEQEQCNKDVSVTETTQKKEEESKVKESKVNKTKREVENAREAPAVDYLPSENIEKIIYLHPQREKEKSCAKKEKDFFAAILADQIFIELTCKSERLKPEQIPILLQSFTDYKGSVGQNNWRSYPDFRENFRKWIPSNIERVLNSKKNDKKHRINPRRKAAVDAILDSQANVG